MIGSREPLAHGLRRVTVDQFDLALQAMRDAPVDVAVHEVRKATKRLRAILRLVAPTLGKRFAAENATLRDTARRFAPYRDAHVRLASLESLRDRFAAQLRVDTFAGAAEHLDVRRTAEADRLLEGEWQPVVYALRAARARYAAWPVDRLSARAHGTRLVSHEFGSVADGLGVTYSRGREEMAEAGRRPSADAFHAWRKRAKYLRHQMEFLSPIFPDALAGYAASLGRLGDLLGDEHDLAELLRHLAANPGICADPVERALLVAMIQHRRAELQRAALSLGSRVYAEPAGRFVGRIGDYWSAWDRPVPVGFTE